MVLFNLYLNVSFWGYQKLPKILNLPLAITFQIIEKSLLEQFEFKCMWKISTCFLKHLCCELISSNFHIHNPKISCMGFSLVFWIQIPIVDIVSVWTIKKKRHLLLFLTVRFTRKIYFTHLALMYFRNPELPIAPRPPRKLQSTTGPPTMYVM